MLTPEQRSSLRDSKRLPVLLLALVTLVFIAATAAAARWNLPRNNVDCNVARHPGLWPWLLMRAN